jgi:hypothetical protein
LRDNEGVCEEMRDYSRSATTWLLNRVINFFKTHKGRYHKTSIADAVNYKQLHLKNALNFLIKHNFIQIDKHHSDNGVTYYKAVKR